MIIASAVLVLLSLVIIAVAIESKRRTGLTPAVAEQCEHNTIVYDIVTMDSKQRVFLYISAATVILGLIMLYISMLKPSLAIFIVFAVFIVSFQWIIHLRFRKALLYVPSTLPETVYRSVETILLFYCVAYFDMLKMGRNVIRIDDSVLVILMMPLISIVFLWLGRLIRACNEESKSVMRERLEANPRYSREEMVDIIEKYSRKHLYQRRSFWIAVLNFLIFLSIYTVNLLITSVNLLIKSVLLLIALAVEFYPTGKNLFLLVKEISGIRKQEKIREEQKRKQESIQAVGRGYKLSLLLDKAGVRQAAVLSERLLQEAQNMKQKYAARNEEISGQ